MIIIISLNNLEKLRLKVKLWSFLIFCLSLWPDWCRLNIQTNLWCRLGFLKVRVTLCVTVDHETINWRVLRWSPDLTLNVIILARKHFAKLFKTKLYLYNFWKSFDRFFWPQMWVVMEIRPYCKDFFSSNTLFWKIFRFGSRFLLILSNN